MKWVLDSKYEDSYGYVDDDGRLRGGVVKSNDESGFDAFDAMAFPARNLGRYATVDGAKQAVEEAPVR